MIALRQTLAVLRREAAAFLAAPIAAIVAVLFLVVQGFSFFAVVRVLADPRRPAPYGAVLRTHFGGTFLYWAFMFFVAAALTMRVVAEERRSGTWEVLRTAPVSAPAIVCGKWLGAFAAYLVLWIPTLAYVAILWWLAPAEAAPDAGPIATAYLGVALTGGSALAIGVLASAGTRSQIVAAALTFVTLLLLLLVGLLPDIAPEAFARSPTAARVVAALDVRRHMDDFARGVVDLRHVAVHAGLAFTALIAAAATIEVERRPRERGLAALGVTLAAIVALFAAMLAARHPLRLDATRARVYTLEARTRQILDEVHAPVSLLILSAGRPEFAELYDEVRELARRFGAASPEVRVEALDPSLDPGRFAALAAEVALAPEELSGGGAVIVSSGERRRAVGLLDMAGFSGDGPERRGRLAWFRGEEALAAAVLEVTDPERPTLCASTGHGEPEVDGDELERVVAGLGRDGVTARSVSLHEPVPPSCASLALFGPRRPLAPDEVAAVAALLERGGRLLVALDESPTGLEPLLERHGVAVRRAVVVDPAAELGAPLTWATLNGYGDHPISAGFRGRRLTVWHAPRWVEPLRLPDVKTDPLVSSSPAGWAERDPASLRVRAAEGPDRDDVRGPVAVAVAAERREARVVVFGAARSFATAELERTGAANDALLVSSVAWLTGRTKLLGIGAKTPEQLRIALTAAQERALFWICVVLLPLAVGVAGGLAAWRRRRT